MALPIPTTLSPSKVTAFKDCALAFRFSAIDKIVEPTSPAMAKGTLVHEALERLFGLDPAARTEAAAQRCLDEAMDHLEAPGGDIAVLGLLTEEREKFVAEARTLTSNYFKLEDPSRITPIGLELRLEADLGDARLVGIIDRLELDPDGELIVTDYKTGRAPGDRYEQNKLGGVHFYSFLCEAMFGRRPAKVQLLHLAEPVVITSVPTEQSTKGLRVRVNAIWDAVEKACEQEDFRPKPGPLCNWCTYKAWCPSFGGDPTLAAVEGGIRIGPEISIMDSELAV